MAKTMREQIADYLQVHATMDPVFAEKMNNPRKNMDNLMRFIALQAYDYMRKHSEEFKMKNGFGGDIPDEIVFGFANHYYDEENLDIDRTEEERKAEREKADAERKAKAEQANKETATAKKPGGTGAKKNAKTKKAETPKPVKQKSASEILAKERAKAEKRAQSGKKEEKMKKSEMKKGNDCYDMFSEFFN